MRLPVDNSPMPGMHVASDPRIAWLVASMRVHSPDPVMHRRRDFAEALSARGVRADLTRLSRWESGNQPIPTRVLAGYEQLFGLRPGHLTCLAEGLKRSLDPGSAGGKLLSAEELANGSGDLDEIFNRIETDAHDGLDWTRLAANLEAEAHFYLPPVLWTTLASKLIGELIRSYGVSHVRRYEASRTLFRNPKSQRLMLKAVGTFVTDPGAQVVEPALTLLQELSDPQASDLVLRMLASESRQVRRGAAWVTATKVARDHFDEASMDALEALVPRLMTWRKNRWFPSEGIDVLAALDPERQERVLAAFHGNPHVPGVRQNLEWGELVPPDRSRKFCTTVARRTQRRMNPDAPTEPDDLLGRLLREALFHVHRERRHQAALLLGASAYAADLATALAESLGGADETTTARGLTLMLYLAPPEDLRGQLLTWGLHHPSVFLRSRALMALAHLRTPIDADAQQMVLQTTMNDENLAVQAAALYLLGTLGSPALATLIEQGNDHQRATAHWWMNVGSMLTDEPLPALG